MVMDDDSAKVVRASRRVPQLLAATAIALAGCTTYVGTTARSFLGHVRNNPDPNVRFLAYSKLASPDAYDSPEQKSEAAAVLIDKLERGREPVATRAIICRTLGELREPKARDVLIKSVSSSEAVVKIEAVSRWGRSAVPKTPRSWPRSWHSTTLRMPGLPRSKGWPRSNRKTRGSSSSCSTAWSMRTRRFVLPRSPPYVP